MPTSSKLGKIIKLNDQRVYLLNNTGKNLRTKYKVHSILKDDNLILLDLNSINNLFFSKILLNDIAYLPERTIDNIKVDFINNEKKEIIEIKGLISEENEILFPHSNSNRIIRQLKELSKSEYKVRFIFILMNPRIEKIRLDTNNFEFIHQINSAIKKNIKLQIYKICWKDTQEYLEEVKFSFKNNIFKLENPI